MERFAVRMWNVTLGTVLWMVLAALPAFAGVSAYIKVDGAKRGQFKGEVTRNGSSQWIPVIAVAHEVASPRDVATGQASGKRQHKPVTITMALGAASPQFQRAQADHEALGQVVIEFVRMGPQGKEQVYQTVTLTNALVTHIQRSGANQTGRPGKMEQEEIELTFEKIEVTANGKTTASDDWSTK